MDTANLSSVLSGVMQNPEMMSKLQGILSDPEAMQTISKAASSLGGMSPHEPTEKERERPSLPAAKNSDEAKNRAALISALKPYLSEERREKADKLLSLLSLLSVSGVLGNLK